MFLKVLELTGTILSIHPLFYILKNRKYSADPNLLTFYLIKDWVSILCTKRYIICTSILSYIFMIFSDNFIFGIPLSIVVYICFIRDRFKSTSRGQGAPGYFSFLYINTLFFNKLITQNTLTESFLFQSITIISQVIFCILFLEYGFIFLSAGLFKLRVSINEPISTALALVNPNWSKHLLSTKYIELLKQLINWTGPIVQIIGGLLILSFVPNLQIIGFASISLIFISITPFYKLSWLCPSIAFTGILNIFLINEFQLIDFKYSLVLVILRSLVLIRLFLEFFHSLKAKNFFEKSINTIYRKYFGTIIWRVLTFDIVKIVTPTNLLLDSKNKNELNIEEILRASKYTNVYDSINLVSLISSKNYLDNRIWLERANHYMKVENANKLIWIEINKEYAKKSFALNKTFEMAKLNFYELNKNISISEKEENKSFYIYNRKK